MADSFVRIPPDDSGKRLDAESLTVAATPVFRERHQIAGALDVEILAVRNTDPADDDYGIVVRPAPQVSPRTDFVTSSSLAPDASVNLDATTISAATTGKLLQLLVSSSAPCKWEFKTRDGAVEVLRFVIFTSGVTGEASKEIRPSNKEAYTHAHVSGDENFRVTVTNLGQLQSADVYTTFEWDEV